MLSIGKIRSGRMTYHLDAVADGVEDYYFSPHEAPGTWVGAACGELGLAGVVSRDGLVRLLHAEHPVSGVPYGSGRRGHRTRDRLPGFDISLSAPKSVSLLWALTSDDTVRAQVQEGHDAAVAGALRYLESVAALTRRGVSGRVELTTTGTLAAAFRHRTSRAGDPELHTHLVVPNLVHGSDDRWTALDGCRLYTSGKSAGFVYQALLRGELTRRLGVVWGPVRNGHADIEGTPAAVLRAFSQRRVDIVTRRDAVAENLAGAVGEALAVAPATVVSAAEIALEAASHLRAAPATSQLAALETRRAKHPAVDMHTVVAEWRERAQQLGYTDGDRRGQVARQSLVPMTAALYARMASRLGGEAAGGLVGETDDHLARQSSTFSRREIVMGWCAQFGQGATSLDQIATLTDHFVSTHPAILRAEGQPGLGRGDGIRLANGDFVAARSDRVRYTTRAMRAMELALVGTATGRLDDRLAIAPPASGDHAVGAFAAASGRPLTSGQKAAVRQMTGSGAGVDVIVGRAGSGKTTALGVARQAWEAGGIPVYGAAKSAAAARTLELETGIPSRTLDSLLHMVRGDRDRSPLPPGGVLVIDEAAMIETRTLSRLLAVAGEWRWKTVLVGDDQQLREIDAGGGFRALRQRLGAVVLEDNLRQQEIWEREAVDLVRRGEAVDALAAYIAHDRVTITGREGDAHELMVERWWSRRWGGGMELLQARRNADVAALNRLVHERRVAAGEVAPHGVRIGEVEIGRGDRVLTRVTSARDGVINGLRGEVVAVDAPREVGGAGLGGSVTVRVDGGSLLRLGGDYLERVTADGRIALDLAYATTVHRNQGSTAERAQVLVDAGMTADALYVALTRGRRSNEMVVVSGAARGRQPEVDHWEEGRAPRRAIETCLRVIEAAAPKRLSLDTEEADEPRSAVHRSGAVDELVVAWRHSVDGHGVAAETAAMAPLATDARPDPTWSDDPHLVAIARLLEESRSDVVDAAERYERWCRAYLAAPSARASRHASGSRTERAPLHGGHHRTEIVTSSHGHRRGARRVGLD